MPSRLMLGAGLAVMLPLAARAASAERPIDFSTEFNRRVDVICPQARVARLPPGDIEYLQEQFVGSLSPSERQAFDRAIPREDGGPKACADRNGISCPTAWNMIAFKRTGLLERFAHYACAHPKPD